MATYQEVVARSALNRSAGPHVSWTLNPYRGCVHACQYCYARATHSYLDLDWHRDFERIVFVKTNLPGLLRRELGRPAWKHDSVAIGSAADPYQPAEGRYRLTRRCLEAFADAASPCTVLTKGTLVVRDVDVLSDLAGRTGVEVEFSLTTLDERLARQLEPHAPPPRQRLRALARLRSAGVPAGVLLCPVLPGLTDSPEQLDEVVRAAADSGAVDLWAGPLRLAPLVKDHFLGCLDGDRPALAAAYRRAYAFGADLPRSYRVGLERRVEDLKARHGLGSDEAASRCVRPLARQLGLPLLSG